MRCSGVSVRESYRRPPPPSRAHQGLREFMSDFGYLNERDQCASRAHSQDPPRPRRLRVKPPKASRACLGRGRKCFFANFRRHSGRRRVSLSSASAARSLLLLNLLLNLHQIFVTLSPRRSFLSRWCRSWSALPRRPGERSRGTTICSHPVRSKYLTARYQEWRLATFLSAIATPKAQRVPPEVRPVAPSRLRPEAGTW